MAKTIAFRVRESEGVFLEKKAKELKFSSTELIKYCIHKSLINPKITVEEYRKRVF